MSSQSEMQPLPLKDLEENLEELLARCRQMRQDALRNQQDDASVRRRSPEM
ncbi:MULTISPECIES: hypothetical protein [unclassified Coleofasciculus]|uniref:hypothetical protein n=1 Tax=unclassified Coleofasciculus TaxID=2692782 RepID=UPI00187E7917|nr:MULTISPECIES: hypothetical protein [unclassified Coleofasciculus]MBE9127748.1 hypothetical protein [Coleofasciculus sp. LEGE 07081]MBE9150716.1 hypothetical protein [Coleofasciculus sp. LEGE 07092]